MTALVGLTCATCGAEFQRYRSGIKPGSTPYCSIPCRGKGVGASQKGSKRTFSKDPYVTLICTCCSAEFQRYRSLANSPTGRYFCSSECQAQVGSRPRTGETRSCAQCSTEYYNKPGENRSFCSVPCANAARRTVHRGACAHCGTETTWGSPSRAKVYCSVSCATLARSRAAEASREQRPCLTCGENFAVRAKRKWQRYCSRACIPERERVAFVVTPCERCSVDISHRATEVRRFCSSKCAQLAITEGAGGWINDAGYRFIYADGKRILEHRHVMAQTLGHPVPDEATVHHRNGNKLDNRPENLQLWGGKHPKGQDALDLLDYARWIIETFGPDEPRLRELAAQQL